MRWQRGFLIEDVDVGYTATAVRVTLVHADSPQEAAAQNCFKGCCAQGVPRPVPDFCSMMPAGSGREEYYGWCDDWDLVPPDCTSL